MFQCHHFTGGGNAFRNRQHMSRPTIERGAFLGRPIVALIHSGNAAAAAANVVQDGFCNLEPDAKPLQARGDCSA
jgi:hypothetical protein